MKKFILALLLVYSRVVYSQNVETETFSFGYAAGALFQALNIGRSFDRTPNQFVSSDRMGAGAELGVWGQWKLLPALQVRPTLQFSYVSNRVHFWSNDGNVEHRSYAFGDLALPVHLLLVNQFRRLPATGIFLIGGRLSWNLTQAPAGAALHLLPERLGIDLGIGAGFNWQGWKIQPEFIYTYGLNNIHNFTNSPYDWSVGRIVTDRLSLRVVLSIKN